MKKHDKEILQSKLSAEEKVIRELKQVYARASKDCAEKIAALSARTDLENIQSIVYQKQYQKALKDQLDSVLTVLQTSEFEKISDYLKNCYDDGFISAMYSLNKQGIPLIIPIDQKAVLRAIQTDSKLSTNLYTRLGEDVTKLKTSVRAEISRGIANGSSYNQIAEKIAKGMNTPFDKAFNSAIRIARTEGNRISSQSAVDACKKAKEKGADIVKQWDATLDGDTRPSHKKVDGEIREMDEEFSNGLMYPGDPSGGASEVVNCRCALLQRASWALDEDELERLKERAEFFDLDKTDSFTDFKKKYLNALEDIVKINGWNGLNYPQNYKSKKEAIKALKDKYGIDFSDSRKYPINETMLCDFVSWMDAFEKEYPDFVKGNPVKVPKLCVKAPSSMKNAVGYFQYYTSSRQPIEIALNGYYHSSMSIFEEYEKNCIERKWTVANATFHKTFVHEYGHYVSNTISKMKSDMAWEHNFINECIEAFKKEVPEYQRNTYVGLGDYLSRYGSTSESECFAEAFAEYFGNENPRPFARIFGEKLEEVLKGAV